MPPSRPLPVSRLQQHEQRHHDEPVAAEHDQLGQEQPPEVAIAGKDRKRSRHVPGGYAKPPSGHARSRPGRRRATSVGMVIGAGAVEIAHSGSFRPWPVTVQTTVEPGRQQARSADLQQAGDARRAAQLDEDADACGPAAGTRTGSPGR